ncbi:MAG: tRNA lysidine(34) synthetase TilS, partial [Opitutales bacterium]
KLANELSGRMDTDCLEPSVAGLLRQRKLNPILLACSGGADSVFLLCLLFARRRELGLDLHVAHYNHRWRGDVSNRDAEFVSSLAEALGLPFFTDERPENQAAFTETTARALRLDFLRKAAGEAGCPYIAFGHQLDDILETQLQRIARGAGIEGLAAPRPVATFDGHPTHLRPLLKLRAGDIRMTMNTVGAPWCEDISNEDTSIARNVLRHEVIPDLMQALDRDPAVGAARSRRLLEEDALALDQLTRERMPEAFLGDEFLSRRYLCALPSALMRRALTAWLHTKGLLQCFSASALDLLLQSLASGEVSSRQSAGSSFVSFDADKVWVEGNEYDSPLEHVQFKPGEAVVLSNGYLLETEFIALDEETRDSILSGGLDPRMVAVLVLAGGDSLGVRAWRPGDRFQPLGAPGSRKLKDWFIDRRIPKRERTQIPVVVNSTGEVVWVPGFAPAESSKIVGSTKQALRLTYRPRNPR